MTLSTSVLRLPLRSRGLILLRRSAEVTSTISSNGRRDSQLAQLSELKKMAANLVPRAGTITHRLDRQLSTAPRKGPFVLAKVHANTSQDVAGHAGGVVRGAWRETAAFQACENVPSEPWVALEFPKVRVLRRNPGGVTVGDVDEQVAALAHLLHQGFCFTNVSSPMFLLARQLELWGTAFVQ